MLKEIKYLNIMAINKYSIIESDCSFYKLSKKEILHISYLGYSFYFTLS